MEFLSKLAGDLHSVGLVAGLSLLLLVLAGPRYHQDWPCIPGFPRGLKGRFALPLALWGFPVLGVH